MSIALDRSLPAVLMALGPLTCDSDHLNIFPAKLMMRVSARSPIEPFGARVPARFSFYWGVPEVVAALL